MNLRESIKKHLILEKRIGQISSNFEVVFGFDIVTTKHSNYRGAGRDIEDYNQRPVSNDEIVEFIQIFKKRIAEKIISGEITKGTPFVLVCERWELSMPIVPEQVQDTYWKLIVTSVFRESQQHKLKIGEDQVVLYCN